MPVDPTPEEVPGQDSPRPPVPSAVVLARFEALLEPVLGPALSFAISLTRQREDAEDLVQAAAVRALAAFERFDEGTNFRAWFFRILFNGFLHHKRDAGRRPATSDIDEVPEPSLYARMKQARLARREGDPASALLAKVDAQAVRQALAALPEEFRVVAVLFFVEECSYAEIASIVGCPVGTVRSRLFRARRVLQHELWQVALDSGVVSGSKPARKK